VKQCGLFSFATTVADTVTDKCNKIAANLNVAACTSLGYTVNSTNCATTHVVTVTDSCSAGVVEFQTKNEGGDVFSSDTGSTTEVDYEQDLISPFCKDVDNTPGNFNEMNNQVTLAGVATGTAISAGEPSHVEMTVGLNQDANTGGPFFKAEFNTAAGQKSSDIAEQLEEGLTEQGVQGVTVVGGRAIRVAQPATGSPISVGVASSDTGINFDSRVAPLARLHPLFPFNAPIPTLSTWSTLLLVALLLGTGSWLIRRRKRTA